MHDVTIEARRHAGSVTAGLEGLLVLLDKLCAVDGDDVVADRIVALQRALEEERKGHAVTRAEAKRAIDAHGLCIAYNRALIAERDAYSSENKLLRTALEQVAEQLVGTELRAVAIDALDHNRRRS